MIIFTSRKKVFLAEEQQYWTDIGRTSDRKLGTFKTKSFEWFTASLEQLTSARAGSGCGYSQHLSSHTHLSVSIMHPREMVQPREVEGEWALPPPGQNCCRKFIWVRVKWDFEKFAWALRGFLSNYNIVVLLVAQKFTDSIMLSRMASPCPTLDWQTPFSNLKKYWVWFEEVPLADCSPLPAFCPFRLLSQALHNATYKP